MPRHEKTCLREFPTRSDSNWPAQLQKLARVLKFLETRGIILSRQRTTRALIRLRGCQADLSLYCLHMAKTDFLMAWLMRFCMENMVFVIQL